MTGDDTPQTPVTLLRKKRAEARDLSAPIDGWSTEVFDPGALQEAQALLEELGV